MTEIEQYDPGRHRRDEPEAAAPHRWMCCVIPNWNVC